MVPAEVPGSLSLSREDAVSPIPNPNPPIILALLVAVD
jgi:hypothetical protein